MEEQFTLSITTTGGNLQELAMLLIDRRNYMQYMAHNLRPQNMQQTYEANAEFLQSVLDNIQNVLRPETIK